jgi:glycosyltransferase involved in cell wall biosynthesis
MKTPSDLMLRDLNAITANRLALVIPAYRPSEALVDLVRALVEKDIGPIVIVDDGSGPEYQEVFSRAAAFPDVILLRHATNLGKGSAVKTGINSALCDFPALVGIVTADADGQHDAGDVERVAHKLLARPDCLVLGSRSFGGGVPFRSRLGNLATRAVIHVLMGQKLADTQTGLRGIPVSLLPRLLRIESTGYEFELEMLIAAHHWPIDIIEVPIRTIYAPGNKSSHFNPIIDSMKIYYVLLRFSSVSLLTALLDTLVFYLAYSHSSHLLTSQILGRMFGVGFNYSMVRSSVFHSRQGHQAVLPKYLLLVLVSGTASYAGIRFLSSRLGINAVPAKVLVETLLFLVNFTVQRTLIFKPGESSRKAARPPEAAGVSLSWLVCTVLIGALGLEVYGFSTGNLFSQEIWSPVGLQRFVRFAGMYVALATPVLLVVPWTFAALVSGLALIGTAVSVGPQPLLAVVFFLLSSCALGSRLLERNKDYSIETQVLSTLLGLGIYIFLMTVLARLPVNYGVTWAVMLAIPLLLDLRGVWRRLARWGEVLRSTQLRSAAERSSFALLVLVLLAHWFVALTPESSTDGLAMHLAIPVNIASHHVLTFEPSRFLWAVMPMGADFTYAITYLLGGEYAAHLLDFAMLLVLEALLYFAARRSVGQAAGFLLAALFATTPLVYLATGSLFVENTLAAMVLGCMTAIWRFGESGEKRFLYLAALLGGTALATKFGAAAFLAMALPFAAWEVRRHWKVLGGKPVAACMLAAGLFLLTALPMYAIAWWKTGNPLFPFLNQRFPSRLLDPKADIRDLRFLNPLSWSTPYDLTFHSSKTYEGLDGSFGFQYLVMAPLCLAAIFFVKRRPSVSAAVVSLGAATVVMGSVSPNARYLYAALPLLTVSFAGLLGWAYGQRWLYRTLLSAAIPWIAINLYFLPSVSDYHKDFYLRQPFSRAERERTVGAAAPIRDVIAYYNRTHPHSTVLLASGPEIAGLEGDIYENHWHQFGTLEQLRNALTVPDMVRVMQGLNVQYFIANKPIAAEPVEPAALRGLLENCTAAEYEFGDVFLAHWRPGCEQQNDSTPPGFHDDFDPSIVFHGDWTKSAQFDGPDRHTISYTNVPDAEVSFAFEGTALTYVFTKAWNRGLASVTIDGISQGTIDLYSPNIEWQSRQKFCCLGAGRHVAAIRVVGQSNPKSKGNFIDLDSFVVE